MSAIGRMPGYAFALTWSVGALLLFGSGAQSGLSLFAVEAVARRQVRVRAVALLGSASRSKMHAYWRSSLSIVHSCPLIGFWRGLAGVDEGIARDGVRPGARRDRLDHERIGRLHVRSRDRRG